jgi:hypothetical protein
MCNRSSLSAGSANLLFIPDPEPDVNPDLTVKLRDTIPKTVVAPKTDNIYQRLSINYVDETYITRQYSRVSLEGIIRESRNLSNWNDIHNSVDLK